MGMHADDCVEMAFDAANMLLDDDLDTPDLIEAGILNEGGGLEQHPLYAAPTPATKTCRCCGKGGLTWGRVDGRWLLFDGDEMHACPVNPYDPELARPADVVEAERAAAEREEQLRALGHEIAAEGTADGGGWERYVDPEEAYRPRGDR